MSWLRCNTITDEISEQDENILNNRYRFKEPGILGLHDDRDSVVELGPA